MFGLTKVPKDEGESTDEPMTFLARGFEFTGVLSFEGTVRIDGFVSGEIHAKGTLILGEHAVIDGDVKAGTVLSSGTINGNVIASERVRLDSTAALLGSIKAPLLELAEGVRFRGSCETSGLKPSSTEQRELAEQSAQMNKPRPIKRIEMV
jgi:cytoskeletal protein CcmA (bactofilin family)